MTDDFPIGTALISALIDLHRETDDDDVLDLIETEIVTEVFGFVSVAVPDEKPAPEASVASLLEVHERFAQRDKTVGRYIRLRIFEELEAFEAGSTDQDEDENDILAGLTDDQLRYLQSVDEDGIQMIIESETTQRGLDETEG
jgi:hypothetical protein